MGNEIITKGTEFEYESNQLGKYYSELKGAEFSLKNHPRYADPFWGNPFDKFFTKNALMPHIETAVALSRREIPYSHRADLRKPDGSIETFYIGPTDARYVIVDHHTNEEISTQLVYSYNRYPYDTIINIETDRINYDGQMCDVELQRQIDISSKKLRWFTDLATREMRLENDGLTDSFLLDILKRRKHDHEMKDIIATIRNKQREIVKAYAKNNIIVQGCAGSGKTMVMLHRLSQLQYDSPKKKLENSLVLTPNEQFSLHIKDIAASMAIGNIERLSIERYYYKTLNQYDNNFCLLDDFNKLQPEANIECQEFIDYLYSDKYLPELEKATKKVIDEQYELIDKANAILDYFSRGAKVIRPEVPADVIKTINKFLLPYINKVSKIERSLNALKKEEDNLMSKIGHIQLEKELLNLIVKKSENYILQSYIDYSNELLVKLKEKKSIGETKVEELKSELTQVKNAFFMLRKNERIRQLEKEIDECERANALSYVDDDFGKINDVLSQNVSNSQKIERLLVIQKLEGLENNLETIKDCYLRVTSLDKKIQVMESILLNVWERTEKIKEEGYPETITEQLLSIRKSLRENTPRQTFRKVFLLSTEAIVKSLKIRRPSGIHRYELFAQMFFAANYYRKYIGDYKFICVDEGQDLAFLEYALMFEMNQENVVFNIFGDTNQLLKPNRGISNWDMLVEAFRCTKYELNENYRNTNQITDYCNEQFNMNLLKTGVDGVGISYVNKINLEKELQQHYQKDDMRVAVIVSRAINKGELIELTDENIDYYSFGLKEDKISIMYVDEAKGIEFNKVYVYPEGMSKNESYIACTRALWELCIVID